MELEIYLADAIGSEARKLSDRHHAYHNAVQLEFERKMARISGVSSKEIALPEQWGVDRKFNPFYVHKHRAQIARSIAKKIAEGTYKPEAPFMTQVPKGSGGMRDISVYQIPDAAVSNLFYKRLLSKNKHRFSSYSYAYRDDRNVHFAIQDIALELSGQSRLFVAEFDFSKFFPSINHDYLNEQLEKNAFQISDEDRVVINAFLNGMDAGVPQGTSISLFLANLVCWRMDKEFERKGLRFARYADDTIVWAESYEKITQAQQIVASFSSEAGVAINRTKSPGISLLIKDGDKSELANVKNHVDFLGYAISTDHVSIKEGSVWRIKRDISYILYKHLIQPLKGPRLRALKIPGGGTDESLVSALFEIRRYLYGDLTEEKIRSFIMGRRKRIYFKGLMSYYPLVDNEKQLRALDGWLATAVYKAIRKRSRMLRGWSMPRSHVFPFNVARRDIVDEFARKLVNGKRVYRLPSFYRIYWAIQRGLASQGISGVMNPGSNFYNY